MNLGNTSVMITMMILIDIGDDSVDDLDDDGSSGGAGERRIGFCGGGPFNYRCQSQSGHLQHALDELG